MHNRRSSFLGRADIARPRVAAASNPDAEPVNGSLPLEIARELVPVAYDGKSPLAGRVWKVKSWSQWNEEQRVAFMRAFTIEKARDPAIAVQATRIFRAAKVAPRDYEGQWKALLRWVQTRIMYVNERDERLASPQFSLAHRMGDCDDMAILLAALGDSVRLPWRFCISGRDKQGNRHRWIEGAGHPDPMIQYVHIYLAVGWPPFSESPTYTFAEPTMRVPLGWDVVSARNAHTMPEMQ